MESRPPPDLDDLRAPTHEAWEQMSHAEQERVVEALPARAPARVRGLVGDPHRDARTYALDTLSRFFRRVNRRVYLSSGLPVYYPDEPCMAPDLFAVLDAEPHPRMKWVVDRERRGLDFVMEIRVIGDAREEHEHNLERYAALGITEYFLFDRGRLGLRGFRLPATERPSAVFSPRGSYCPPAPRVYEPILPQGGRFASSVLGLDLTVHGGRVRFFHGTAPLLAADELLGQLEAVVDELGNEKAEADRTIETLRQHVERERDRADRAERVNAKLRGELARLRGEG
ncbi:MAG: Uma2 family endonuclease [Polyangiaceae bacterium]|nr:Uma2 family endonuclease [Polyangiaceae bacterium]